MSLAVATKGVVGSPAKRSYHAGAASMTRGLAVVRGADDEHVAIAGANVSVLGFVEESTVSAEDPISIVEGGGFIAKIGAAITAGQALITDSSGRLVPTAAAGDQIVAQALSSGANANDYIVAKVMQSVRGASAPEVDYVASGALAVAPSVDTLGSGAAILMLLGTPSAGQGGITKKIVAVTAHAHTVTTAANKIQDANSTGDTITFAHVGDFVELLSIGVSGVWQIVTLRGASLSEV
jgi:hypothetical protein